MSTTQLHDLNGQLVANFLRPSNSKTQFGKRVHNSLRSPEHESWDFLKDSDKPQRV